MYGMLRVVEHLGRRAALDDLAALHDDAVVGQLPHDGQVVRDQDVGDARARRGCRQAGSAPAPGSRRRARPPTRPGSAPAARPPAPGRSRRAGAGRPTAAVAARASAARPGRPARPAPARGSRRSSLEPPRCSRSTSSIEACTVCRGSRLEYGSWKTICTSAPRRRRSAPLRAGVERSRPRARMTPAVGRSRPMIMRATVVLPEPDSPTTASDRPASTRNDTSSTATSGPNSLRRPSTSTTASDPASDMACRQGRVDLLGADAAHDTGRRRPQLRVRLAAAVLRRAGSGS